MNRLKLNFGLQGDNERAQFLKEYFEGENFKKKPLDEDELETCANYVLWGKNENGKNLVQEKKIEIKTKAGIWDKKEADESLDFLLETPTFNENSIIQPHEVRPRTLKETFSRSKALKEAPEELKETFKNLFKQIDELDLAINFYDLKSGRRKNPPRPELLAQFKEEEINQLRKKGEKWNQYTYLKMRHLLVELRREQFSLRDFFSEPVQRHTLRAIEEPSLNLTFDSDIPVFPLGVFSNQEIPQLIFKPINSLLPDAFSETELKKISKFYWDKKNNHFNQSKFYFDFQDQKHVYALLESLGDLEESIFQESIFSTTNSLITTLKYYIDNSKLSDIYKEILDLKIKKFKNQEVANIINEKYDKSYSGNYVSTIFCQKVIGEINRVAQLHALIVENLAIKENFKKCSTCGVTKLATPDYFVRKSIAKDGLSGSCKECDKKKREELKKRKTERGGK